MNILIIPAFFQTKAKPTLGSFFMEQAMALNRAGNSVTVLYCDTYSVKRIGEWAGYSEEPDKMQDGIKIYRKKVFCPLKHGIEGHRDAFAKGIAELYYKYVDKNQDIDIIHAHCCVWAGYAAMSLSKRTSIPYVITEHATLFHLHKDKISAPNNKYISEAFEKASKVICVSSAFKELISEYRPQNDIEVVGNVTDCNIFKPPADNSESNMQFLTVCYMETEAQLYKKGIDVLIKAWKNIVSIYPKARLVIGGGGHALSKVVEWCNEYGISDSVEFKGALNRNQVVRNMQSCDFFVLPSRYETFGVVYIEAMACGKPVIAVKNGGPDDFIHDFNGILIQPENVEELEEAMKYMISHRNMYDSEKISGYVRENFSEKAIAGKLEKIYGYIADRKNV